MPYSGVGKISKIALFCRFLLHKKLIIQKVCAIAGFCAKLKVAILGFYCTYEVLWKFYFGGIYDDKRQKKC